MKKSWGKSPSRKLAISRRWFRLPLQQYHSHKHQGKGLWPFTQDTIVAISPFLPALVEDEIMKTKCAGSIQTWRLHSGVKAIWSEKIGIYPQAL